MKKTAAVLAKFLKFPFAGQLIKVPRAAASTSSRSRRSNRPLRGASARNPLIRGPAGPRWRWKLANRRPLRHGELGCPWLSHLRFLSSLRRRALADKIEWPAAARPRLSAGSQSARAARRSSSPRRRQSARPTLSGNPHHALWRVEHLYFGSGGGYRRCGSACPNGRPIPHT